MGKTQMLTRGPLSRTPETSIAHNKQETRKPGVHATVEDADDPPEALSVMVHEILSTCAITLFGILSRAGARHLTSSSGSNMPVVTAVGDDRARKEVVGAECGVAREQSDNEKDGGDIGREKQGRMYRGPLAAILAFVGPCLYRIACEVDLLPTSVGAIATILSLLPSTLPIDIREQAALALGAITGQAYKTAEACDLADGRSYGASGCEKNAGTSTEMVLRAASWQCRCTEMLEGGAEGAQVRMARPSIQFLEFPMQMTRTRPYRRQRILRVIICSSLRKVSRTLTEGSLGPVGVQMTSSHLLVYIMRYSELLDDPDFTFYTS